MDKLYNYILSNLSILFFSIFLPLFTIASVIFMIKLATYTAVIQLTIGEMGKLYLFVLPELLFYTLPISFIVGGALTLFRLSNDNEMVVVFSLGISPSFITKVFALPAFLLSILLFINFVVLTPYVNHLKRNFLTIKKSEAKFNLTPSEFGQNFGDWMLFINKSDQNSKAFGDIVLFNKEMKDEILITAKKAELINNNNGVLQLRLDDGKSYSYTQDLLKTMLFQTGYINDMMSKDNDVYQGTLDYWTNNEKRSQKDQQFITSSLLTLFPLLSVPLILALGIVQSRHQKRWIYLWLFLAIVGYYSSSIIVQQWFGFHTIWVVALLWFTLSYGFYKRLVGTRF